MNKKTHYIYNYADYFYPWILGATFMAIGAMVWLRIFNGTNAEFFRPHSFNKWGVGLTCLGLTALMWRVWLAYRYRSYSPADDNKLPMITVVIPAYNESRQVFDTVSSVMNSDYPVNKIQVICVDDGSQDDTWEWMIQACREFPKRLLLIRLLKNSGKRHALMAGFRRAVGSIFITIDSDSEVLPNTLRHLVSPFVADDRVGGVAGNVRVLNKKQGSIPKMMEVNFTTAFDFIRSGQSVYGGVFCTPGALSAYRASVIRPHLPQWANQTFRGVPAMIGEDRALTNCILSSGFRVVYQREAVVLTKIPDTYGGLRRMMLRWARSNVRESLVMATFLFHRFRPEDKGSGWIRFFGGLHLFHMIMGEALKIGIVASLFSDFLNTVYLLVIGCLIASLVPSLVYQIRYRSWNGWRWAVPYSFFWLSGLSWISSWALLSAANSGWLTRGVLPVQAHSARGLIPS